VVEITAKGHSKAYYEHKKAGDWYLSHDYFTEYINHKPDYTKNWILLGAGTANTFVGTIIAVREMLNDQSFTDAYFEALEKYKSSKETPRCRKNPFLWHILKAINIKQVKTK